jgi:hypothetical protein
MFDPISYKKTKDVDEKYAVKTAVIEKELNDFQNTIAGININQEAKQSVTDYGIVSLPRNCANGQVSATVKGETLTNLVPKNPSETVLTIDNYFVLRNSAYDHFLTRGNINYKPSTKYTLIVEIRKNTLNKDITINYADTPIATPIGTIVSGTKGIFKKAMTTKEDFSTAKYDLWLSKNITGIEGEVECRIAIFEGDYTNREIKYINGTKSTVSAVRVKSESADKKQTSMLYLNAGQPLRSLLNGTKDEVSAGKLNKKVSDEYVLDGNSGFKFLDVSFTNTYRMVLDSWLAGKNALLGTTGSGIGRSADGDYPIQGNTAGTDVRSLVLYTNNYLYVYVEKEKVDAMTGATTEDKFKAYLNKYPITLTYQLATPVVTDIQTSGSLFGYPSGTVYVENVLPVAGLYEATGIKVTNSDFPIATLEKISKIDSVTGVETEVAVANAVISADKLSFTHPGLVAGDIVFFTYHHAVEGTVAETIINYYDSRYTIKDAGNGKFYQWKVTANNGVPTITLVEV